MGEGYVTYIVIVKYKNKCRLKMVFLDLEWIERKRVDLRRKIDLRKTFSVFGSLSQPYEYTRGVSTQKHGIYYFVERHGVYQAGSQAQSLNACT